MVLAGCGRYPKDASGTLDRVANGILRVGTTASATASDSALVTGFASQLHAQVRWVHKDQHYLAEQLSEHNLDMAIGGFVKGTPIEKMVALSKPYHKNDDKEYVIAIPKGENAFLMKLEQYIDDYEIQ